MISQGTDGVSRGLINQGSLMGKPLRDYLPLNLSALDRSPDLKVWLSKWAPKHHIFLTPEQWYIEAHDIRFRDGSGFTREMYYQSGTYIWTPPPAAADVALEQLRFARSKRTNSTHIFVVPRLFFTLFRRQLHKEADMILCVPINVSFWPEPMFEPLILAFAFPYSRYKPWKTRRTPKLLSVGRQLQEVWQKEDMDGSDILRKLLLEMGKLPSLSEPMVRKLLYYEQ